MKALKNSGRATVTEKNGAVRISTQSIMVCDACGLTQDKCSDSCPGRKAGGWER